MPVHRTLWALEHATPDTQTNPGKLADALRLHIERSSDGLSTIVMQIGERQQAYLQLSGCSQCHLQRCVPGCRVGLLRRTLRAGLPTSGLRLVPDGLQARPYTRYVLAWPTAAAQPLDASLIHPWRDARLLLHWQWSRVGANRFGLVVGAVLALGAAGPDPLPLLRAAGWRGRAMPFGRRVSGTQPRPAPIRRSWTHDPTVLIPVPAAEWLFDPPGRPDPTLDASVLRSQSHAATIALHMHAAGARIEFLDLHPDTWTATLAATTADGTDVVPLLGAVAGPTGPLQLRDGATATVALDPVVPRPSGMLPPLLRLGTRPDGTSRWRPITSTHHLLLVGSQLAGIVMGLLAPLVASQPALRIGLLDTAGGAIALDLAGVPQRLPTSDGGDVQELLGVLGSLDDPQEPVLVVVYVEDADVCEATVIPLLRAASYLHLSLIIAASDERALPDLLRTRLPIIRVRNRQAQWQAPYGHWRWATPTLLRLPWRDPAQAWVAADPAVAGQLLPPTAGFWAVPEDLRGLIYAADAEAPAPGGDVMAACAADQSAVAVPGHMQGFAETASLPREDGSLQSVPQGDWRLDQTGQLIIDPPLLATVLQWAAGADCGQGITLKGLTAGLQLPSRVYAAQVVDTLVAAGLATQIRDGWFRLQSVAVAVETGNLPPGPWHAESSTRIDTPAEIVVHEDAAASLDRDEGASNAALIPAPAPSAAPPEEDQ